MMEFVEGFGAEGVPPEEVVFEKLYRSWPNLLPRWLEGGHNLCPSYITKFICN